jgi:hypothetical protein
LSSLVGEEKMLLLLLLVGLGVFADCRMDKLLVKSVLSAMPTHFLTIYKMPAWAIKDVDQFCRSFLWRGKDPDKVRGGHCLVTWKVSARPKIWGGLGIKDLEKYGKALRL